LTALGGFGGLGGFGALGALGGLPALFSSENVDVDGPLELSVPEIWAG
jgi:hypothetical protein